MEFTVSCNKGGDFEAQGTELNHHKKKTNKENKDKNVGIQLTKKRLQHLSFLLLQFFAIQTLLTAQLTTTWSKVTSSQACFSLFTMQL